MPQAQWKESVFGQGWHEASGQAGLAASHENWDLWAFARANLTLLFNSDISLAT